ncbi:MAG: hypothetical protein ACXWG5_05960 [Candidatus Aminicenantales bacterium]
MTVADVKVWEVTDGVVELPQPVTPTTSKARRAAPEITARILFVDICISPLLT